MFADDNVIFSKADLRSCGAMKDVLATYEKASGQVINLQKSMITFSPNVSDEVRSEISDVLGLASDNSHNRYLGLPASIGRDKLCRAKLDWGDGIPGPCGF